MWKQIEILGGFLRAARAGEAISTETINLLLSGTKTSGIIIKVKYSRRVTGTFKPVCEQ